MGVGGVVRMKPFSVVPAWGCVWWDCPISGTVLSVGAGCSRGVCCAGIGTAPRGSLRVFPVLSLRHKAAGTVSWP